MADEKISQLVAKTTIAAADLLVMVDSGAAETKKITGANHKTTVLGELENLTTLEIQQLENIDATTISAAQWVFLGSMDQGVVTTDTPEFADLKITGFTQGSLLFVGAAGLIVQANDVLNWEVVNRRLLLGGIVPTGQNTITAGEDNAIISGSNNDITGANSDTAVIVGGSGNTLSNAKRAIILGGTTNTASGDYSLVGAWQNTGSGDYSVSIGGQTSVASGSKSVTLGGNNNAAVGDNSYAMGTQSKANHNGCFVISDLTAAALTTSAINQFLTRYSGGHRLTGGGLQVDTLNTANGILQTDGSGLFSTSVTLPDGTLATTQSPADNSTKLATTAYVEAAVGAEDLWDRVTGTPNYLIPKTAADDIGATGARITKGWFTDIDATDIRVSGPAFEFGPVRSDGDGDLSVGKINLAAPTTDITNILGQTNGGTGFTTTYTDGQLLIGQTSGGGLNRTTLTGTADQVTVTNGSGTITLSLPQDIATTSNPSFATLGIGVGTPDASSILELLSTTKGFLPPRMTATQRDAISSPAEGLHVYDLTNNKPDVYNGTAWKAFVTTDVSTFIPGCVVFATDTHEINDDINLFWDNTNKRLGIGTDTPSDSLHVAARIRADRFVMNRPGESQSSYIQRGAAGVAKGISFYTVDTERMTISEGGRVGIGTPTPDTSSILDLTSTTGAFLPSRMTTAQKTALTPTNGMIVYDSTLNKFQGYENGGWASFI